MYALNEEKALIHHLNFTLTYDAVRSVNVEKIDGNHSVQR